MTETKISFIHYLLHQSWESCLNAQLESSHYYKMNKNNKKKENNNVINTIKNYFIVSSKTRLLIHGAAALYGGIIVYHLIKNGSQNSQIPIHLISENNNNNNENKTSFFSPVKSFFIQIVRSFTLLKFSNHNNNNNTFLYESAEGMQLVTQKIINNNNNEKKSALLHFFSSLLLIPLSLFLKESIFHMSKQNNNNLKKVQNIKKSHQKIGFFCVFSTFLMFLSGYQTGMAKHSSPSFFLKCFCSPFLFFCFSVLISAKLKKSIMHVMLGNVMIKSIWSVPLARTSASLLQNLLGLKKKINFKNNKNENNNNNEINMNIQEAEALEGCYYVSIGLTAIIIGSTAVIDIYNILFYFYKKYQQKYNLENNQNKKRSSFQVLRESIRSFRFP